MISIVITSDNYARYLPFAVESALDQSVPCQVVAVDDGSTDDSLEVPSRYRDAVEVVAKANGGEASAIHAGLLRATGEAVIILDSDDVLYRDCAEAVRAHFGPGVSTVRYRLDTIDAAGEDRGLPFPHYPPGFSADHVMRMSLEEGWYLYR